MNATTSSIIADDDCPCIDASIKLESLNRTCTTANNEMGVLSGLGLCYPLQYGSNACDTHDMDHDPSCYNRLPSDRPGYCDKPWCYVDVKKCVKSENIVVRSQSNYFSESELFYSYTTCNSTEEAFLNPSTLDLNGIQMTATIPGIVKPRHYKLMQSEFSIENDISADFSGYEYYNDTMQFKGSMVDYVNSIVDFAGVDNIGGITYQHRSKGSDLYFPLSAYTSAVNDVRFGISDIAIGSFWVTAERLRLTSFTTTVQMDKNVLAVPRPGVDNSFAFQTEKLLMPFQGELWLLLLLSILVASILGVWFTCPKSKQSMAWLTFQKENWKTSSIRRRLYLVSRLILDGFLEKAMFFCGGAVEQDRGATLPHKLLMFGFSFLIFIAVSAYVAELAAFLTISGVTEYVDTIEKATNLGTKICANSVLKEELSTNWPDTNFVWFNPNESVYQDLDLYQKGDCQAIVVSNVDRYTDKYYNDMMCELDLVFTNAVVLEIPVAFPINKDLAAGFSSWMYEHSKARKTFVDFEDSYKEDFICDPYSLQTRTSDDLDETDSRITVANMAFAFMLFGACAIGAILLQLFGEYSKDADKFIGRSSTLQSNFISERDLKDEKSNRQPFRRSESEAKVGSNHDEASCNNMILTDCDSDNFEENDNSRRSALPSCEEFRTTTSSSNNNNTHYRDKPSMLPVESSSHVAQQSSNLHEDSDVDERLLQNLIQALRKEFISHHKEHAS